MNPTVCIPPESYVLGRAIRNYKYFSFLPWNLLSRIVISEFESFPQFKSWDINLRGFYQIAQCMPEDDRNLAKLLDNFYSNYASEKMPDSKRWGDKTPVNTFAVNLIHEVFPSSKHIHMIRDGRDVVASYLSAGLYPNVEEAARRWIRSVEAGQSFGRKIGDTQYLEIHYESLVKQPREVVMKVCRFLEMEYLPEMLEPWKRIGYLGDAYLPHHLNLLNPINEDSIGKWETRLNQQDQAYVQNHLQSKLLVLGYSTG